MKQTIEEYLDAIGASATCDMEEANNQGTITFSLETSEWVNVRFHTDNKLLKFEVWTSLSDTTWDIMKRHKEGVSKPMEETFEHIILLIGYLVRSINTIEEILVSIDLSHFGPHAYEDFSKIKFFQLDQHQQAFIKGHYQQRANWLGFLQKETNVVQSLIIGTTIEQTLREKKKQKPSLDTLWAYETCRLHLTYRGIEKNWKTSVSNGCVCLTEGEHTLTFQTEEEVTPFFDSLLKQIEQTASPSTHYYTRWCKKANMQTNISPLLYEQLTQHYTWEAIEDFAAECVKNNCVKEAIIWQENTYLLYFIDCFVIVDTDKNDICVLTEEQEAKTHFETIVTKKQKQKIEQKLEDFMKKIKKPV